MNTFLLTYAPVFSSFTAFIAIIITISSSISKRRNKKIDLLKGQQNLCTVIENYILSKEDILTNSEQRLVPYFYNDDDFEYWIHNKRIDSINSNEQSILFWGVSALKSKDISQLQFCAEEINKKRFDIIQQLPKSKVL